ncbi:hypothetical protein D1AOALGA4SA_4880 [Olavius algarvensis Delta 1 endosymbiont]|nr:hypothetical protein D1AOALGA4SA_4880 [Olavius algarvensis Delta 1 endosymbiont]
MLLNSKYGHLLVAMANLALRRQRTEDRRQRAGGGGLRTEGRG